MPALKIFEKYIPYSLPFLLFFFRGIADLTVVVVSIIFLYQSFKESKWIWAKELWFKYSVIFVIYLATINVYISIDQNDTLFYALTFIRWPIFAAALYFWIFNSKAAIKSFLISLGLLLAFIIAFISLKLPLPINVAEFIFLILMIFFIEMFIFRLIDKLAISVSISSDICFGSETKTGCKT